MMSSWLIVSRASQGIAHLRDLKCLYLGRILDVRTKTEVNQRSASVDRASLRREKILYIVHLVLAVSEHLLEIWDRNM